MGDVKDVECLGRVPPSLCDVQVQILQRPPLLVGTTGLSLGEREQAEVIRMLVLLVQNVAGPCNVLHFQLPAPTRLKQPGQRSHAPLEAADVLCD